LRRGELVLLEGLQPPPSLELVVAWQTGVALVEEVVGFVGRCWRGMRGMWGQRIVLV
jgi:hypothetical protein